MDFEQIEEQELWLERKKDLCWWNKKYLYDMGDDSFRHKTLS
jgi:hypothetical protein